MALETQDVQYATLLSELVYRAAECKTEEGFHAAVTALEREMGTSLPNIKHHKTGGQRYLVSESDAAIYVAFQGTRTPTDWLANLAFFHGPLCHHRQPHRNNSNSSTSDSSSSSSSSTSSRAHGGFLRRANHAALSISALHAEAAAAGKRLILTGHSLGGAVATLTTVRLLRSLAQQQGMLDPCIRCISFATPAVANTGLLQEVAAAGWDRYITNILLPEDPVVPFVNQLLKAPAASPAVSSSSSNLSSSVLSSKRSISSSNWAAVQHMDSSSDALWAACSSSWASLGDLQYSQYDQQQQALAIQAATAGCADWDLDFGPQYCDMPLQGNAYAHASDGLSTHADICGGPSEELASWLAAARGAVQQQRQQRRQLQRSLSEASEVNSSSSSSLISLSASLTESAISSSAGSADSLAAFTTGLEAAIVAASATATQWFAGSSPAPNPRRQKVRGSGELPSKRFNLSKAGITAFLTGAVAAGVRCGAALAAPQLLLAPHVSLFSLIPAALTAPVALAALHLVGKAAVPVSHPLGQQLVMTGAGLERVSKPLKHYPRSGEHLDLQQLGGLFPGHRMIAYRRRMVALLQQGAWQ